MPGQILPGIQMQLTANGLGQFYHIGDGLHYTMEQYNVTHAMFRCLTTGCPGTALWEGAGLVHVNAHNHLPNPLYPAQLALRRRILQRVENGDAGSYWSIFEEESSHFSRAVQAKVPWKLIFLEMKAARTSLLGRMPESVRDVAEVLQLPQFNVMAATMDGEDNLFSKIVRCDNGWDSLILCSSRHAAFLSCVRNIFCVTKHMTTNLDLQLLVLIGQFREFALPLVYCLMEHQTVSSYRVVLSSVKEINPQFNPHCIVTPYDNELREAWAIEFPHSYILDRLHSHFIQDLVEHIKNMPIVLQDFKEELLMCCAIPLAPHDLLHEAFRFITEEAMQHNAFDDILQLFHHIWDKWLTGIRYDTESVSVSPDKSCSANVAVIFSNMMEKFNISSYHSVFFLIGSFAELEQTVTADIKKLQGGILISPSRKITSLHNSSLLAELQEQHISIAEFISGIIPSLRRTIESYL